MVSLYVKRFLNKVLNIWPPSSGYIGNRFTIANNKFIYAISSCFIIIAITNAMIFIYGPAMSTTILFAFLCFP